MHRRAAPVPTVERLLNTAGAKVLYEPLSMKIVLLEFSAYSRISVVSIGSGEAGVMPVLRLLPIAVVY